MILNERNLRIFARSVLFQNKENINEMSFAPDKVNNEYISNHGSMYDRPGPMNPELQDNKYNLSVEEEDLIKPSELVEDQPLGVKEKELTYEI